MAIVHRLLSPLVEVREEESTTLLLMALYSFLAMTAYNILKPLATATFIDVHTAENLPIMILVGGHVKVRNSRQASTAVSVSWSVAVSG